MLKNSFSPSKFRNCFGPKTLRSNPNRAILKMLIVDTALSVRVKNALDKQGVTTVKELWYFGLYNLVRTPSLGCGSQCEVIDFLKENGYEMGFTDEEVGKIVKQWKNNTLADIDESRQIKSTKKTT